ncbi:PREDICTED: uncharacterized protein LOC109224304 [Nicotiana attenuata]|uniref:uncharacterized protein LOC109224304 n=1 Tax=Nicotiana attenuata TaxID=49451 RepID=UPI0009058769|nr:PREDICTED: uncharacterized protein LOC109224304 [Nicotiana attenuata]
MTNTNGNRAIPMEWWIDFGAIRHVCAVREAFATYAHAEPEETLSIGNAATAKIEGCGKNFCARSQVREGGLRWGEFGSEAKPQVRTKDRTCETADADGEDTCQDGQPPVCPVGDTRGRGRGRGCGWGRGVNRTIAKAAPKDPPATPVQDHVLVGDAPAGPAQAVAVSTTTPTSQAWGGIQTPAGCTPEQNVQGLQTPEAPPSQPVAPTKD